MTYSQDRVFSTEGNTWVVAATALSVFPSYESCVVMGLATQAIPIIGASHSACRTHFSLDRLRSLAPQWFSKRRPESFSHTFSHGIWSP